MRAVVHGNEYLMLYEVEPEDRMLFARFGVKFVTQPGKGSLGIRCSKPVQEHNQYEQAILTGLKKYLLLQRFVS